MAVTEWPPIGKIAAHSACNVFLWYHYKYLIVNLVLSQSGFWCGNLFLIAPFPDRSPLVSFHKKVVIIVATLYITQVGRFGLFIHGLLRLIY